MGHSMGNNPAIRLKGERQSTSEPEARQGKFSRSLFIASQADSGPPSGGFFLGLTFGVCDRPPGIPWRSIAFGLIHLDETSFRLPSGGSDLPRLRLPKPEVLLRALLARKAQDSAGAAPACQSLPKGSEHAQRGLCPHHHRQRPALSGARLRAGGGPFTQPCRFGRRSLPRHPGGRHGLRQFL